MSNGTSVLDEMTKGIITRKDQKSATLTPVGFERPRIADTPQAFMAQEAVEQVIRNLRAAGQDALAIAAELERSLGIDQSEEAAKVDAVLAQKEVERQADDRAKAAAGDKRAAKRVADSTVVGGEDPEPFTERITRLQTEAQAATFAAHDAEPDAEDEVPKWACPKHDTENVVMLTSRLGRNYRSCAVKGCTFFQKGDQ